MGGLSITHWLIVLFVVVLLFGARRLPDTARGLARSLRIFRSEIDKDKDPAGPREQRPTQQGDLASWPRLETSGPAPDSMPPRSTTPAAAQHDLEVPTSAPVPAEPRIVS